MPVSDYDINDMKELAKKRGGKCLSTKYINMYTKLKWKCNKNHIWETSPQVIKIGCWCPRCSGRLANKEKILTIEQMNSIAEKREGECMSNKYTNCHTKLKWKCKNGHIWKATPTSIIHNNTWCNICSGNGKQVDETKHITFKCDNCGKVRREYICKLKNNKHKFCSMKCRNEFVEADITKDDFYHLYFIQV